MSKDGKKERKEKTMKTYEIVKMSKGYYVSTRINGRATARDYFKTKGRGKLDPSLEFLTIIF